MLTNLTVKIAMLRNVHTTETMEKGHEIWYVDVKSLHIWYVDVKSLHIWYVDVNSLHIWYVDVKSLHIWYVDVKSLHILVTYHSAFSLHVAHNFCCIPVLCPKLG